MDNKARGSPPTIHLSPPHMSGHEETFIQKAFASNWIAPMGPNVDGFEKDLAAYAGVKHATALATGTAAIHLAFIILDVQPGDYVICQSMTFSASANPIRYLGAIPAFIDSESDTWNMCPKKLEEAIVACMEGRVNIHGENRQAKAQKPKAIIPVHLYGMPAKMDHILEIAGKYDIPVVEDAAEALGSHINGKRCGSFGTVGILSFNGNKIINTSGGGALLSNNEQLARKARFLATQARDPAPHYQHSEIGYNYRMSNVLAGIGRGQMKVLGERVRQRRANYDFYVNLLKDLEGVSFLPEPEGFYSNRWLTTILVDSDKTGGITRENMRLALKAENIESRPLWKPLHRQPVFAGFPFFNSGVSEKLFRDGLCLPSGSNLTDADRERIGNVIMRVLV